MGIGLKKLRELSVLDLGNKYPSFPKKYLEPTKYTDRTSNGLTKCVIDWINLNGYQAERVNSMGRQIDTRKTTTDVIGRQRTVGGVKWVKGNGQVGTADISATIKGRSVKIEIKCKATKDNKQSLGQIAYQKKIEQAGGIYIIVRTFQDFYDWYNNFLS